MSQGLLFSEPSIAETGGMVHIESRDIPCSMGCAVSSAQEAQGHLMPLSRW